MEEETLHPQVRILVEMPSLADSANDEDVQMFMGHVERTTQALAIVYSVVLSRPHILLGLFNRIVKTTAEMCRDEIKTHEETHESE